MLRLLLNWQVRTESKLLQKVLCLAAANPQCPHWKLRYAHPLKKREKRDGIFNDKTCNFAHTCSECPFNLSHLERTGHGRTLSHRRLSQGAFWFDCTAAVRAALWKTGNLFNETLTAVAGLVSSRHEDKRYIPPPPASLTEENGNTSRRVTSVTHGVRSNWQIGLGSRRSIKIHMNIHHFLGTCKFLIY